jgi:hypothetical protein
MSEEISNADFGVNWGIIKDWGAKSRYEVYSEIQAKEIYESITSVTGGVLAWIQKYW